MSEQQSLLDLVTPPPGQRMVRGIWLTHDLSMTALNDLLLPVLAGLGTTERSAGICAAGLLPEGALTVLAAGDRINVHGFVPAHSVRVIPVTGRRQHAKVAVLQFERNDPTQATATGGILTLVTSANLTAHGLTRNREVFAVEWLPSNGGGASIAKPVLDAIKKLAQQLDETSVRLDLNKLIKAMTNGIPPRAVPSPKLIAHSLAAEPSKSFPETLFPKTQAGAGPNRVLLVGPSFAANNSDVAGLMSPLLTSQTKVDLVVDSQLTTEELSKGLRVEVSSGFLKGLRKRVGTENVTVYASAVDDDQSPNSRRLHGKSIIADYTGRSLQMLGSANLTLRGLQGKNRELVVLVDRPADAGDAGLSEVNAVPVQDGQIVPVADREPLSSNVLPSKTPLSARFVPAGGQNADDSVVTGTIYVQGRSTGTIRLPGGATIHLKGGQASVELDARDLNLSIDDHGQSRPLLVSIDPPDGPEFWTSVRHDTMPAPVDPLLQLLKGDIEIAIQRPHHGSDQGSRTGSANVDDGFRLESTLRLNILTRHRRALRRINPDRLADILDQFFPDIFEKAVAQTVMDAVTRPSNHHTDELLAALIQALRETPERSATS